MGKQKSASEGGVPWVIQPELTEGCSYRYGSGAGGLCHFCGIQAIRSGPGGFKFMSLELADKISAELAEWCPRPRIEFAMRGEPLMNPKHLEIFAMFRSRLERAQMMVTTNGDVLRTAPGRDFHKMAERLPELFAAGIDFVLLDTYYPRERRDALRAEAYAVQEQHPWIKVVDFYDDWAPKGMSPYANYGRKIRSTVVLMDDLAARNGEHTSRVIKSHAGANPTVALERGFPKMRSCGRPFREMTIAWNGDFTLCCDDWRKEFIIGNVQERTLQSLWNDPVLEAARARLYHKDRAWGPCAQCDAPGAPRFGLLPVYSEPSPEQLKMTLDRFVPKEPITKIGG